jgi:hypothetical protein
MSQVTDRLYCECVKFEVDADILRKELEKAKALLADCMNFDSLSAERYVAIKRFLEEGGDGSEG